MIKILASVSVPAIGSLYPIKTQFWILESAVNGSFLISAGFSEVKTTHLIYFLHHRLI